MENVTKFLASYTLPININEHLLGNIFILESKLIPQFFLIIFKKSSLLTKNPLKFTKAIAIKAIQAKIILKAKTLSIHLTNLMPKLLPILFFFKIFILLFLP